ncbi:Protein of unknown function [Ignavigranum ruoffiae]|uniref:Uncharacterized protein n=1 Tax=Ignavigranum ruoffiae TaxID=89093 RepID=A0A1H9BXI5_9LACT|nr:DUF3644 domain-containing protein [Ignavigranum ruoffiae]SEP93283.1 Protein of unknown function [Ignavigranum ruoffiae]
MEDLQKRLVDKSIEAFIMGLEVYNKPTIRYRIEGFSFFICNAWELMLKAELINRKINIYFDDDPTRTISISESVRKIYTDSNTRIRQNLEKIIDLRNISTHFITEDYELKYAPLFQACVINFISEMLRFHNEDITQYIAQNFLTISASIEPLTSEEIKIKYPPEIAEKYIQKANEIDVLTDEYNSDKFSINVAQRLYITKKKDDSDFTISIDKKSNNAGNIIKELKDPSDTHKYSFKSVIKSVNERLQRYNIKIKDYPKPINHYVLNLIIDFYSIKEDEKYCYKHTIGNNIHHTYSQQFVDFIISEIRKNPDSFVTSLKSANKKR